MQNVGIAGDCSEAALAPNRPSRRTEAVKQDTQKKRAIFIKYFQQKKKIVQINTKHMRVILGYKTATCRVTNS